MTNLRVASAGLSMTFGNGAKAKVEAVGDMVLEIPGSDFQSVTLRDVFYIPEASMNMFSIRAAVTRGTIYTSPGTSVVRIGLWRRMEV